MRRAALLVVLALVAVPLSGCLDVAGAGKNGYGQNWPLQMIQADKLHDKGITGKGVKVAVIDTGIDVSHAEFSGVAISWADLVNGRTTAYDDNGHGTHVAGIVAAQGTWSTFFSGYRLKGVSPGVSLLIIKAIDESGHGDEARVAKGVTTAVENGADIIVLSLGGATQPIFGTNTEDAVRNAISHGVFVVAAAGNTDKDTGQTSCTVASPGSVAGVIAVGAVDRNEKIADFSCHGSGQEGSGSIAPGLPSPIPGQSSQDPDKKPETVAPGVDVLSSWKDHGYAIARGTSQAAPMVGGALALLLQARPDLAKKDAATVEDVKAKIETTSKKVGPLSGHGASAHDDYYGYGIIQAQALLAAYGK